MSMREPTYYVLAALQDGPLHGYAILQRCAELSGGRVRMSTGTLYGALERLAAEGLVTPGEAEVVAGRTRRAYALTSEGTSALHAEAERLAAAAAVVRRSPGSFAAFRPGLGTA
ncbi:MAG: PadR family transcriptional regulator [Kineosporiaceae bacterium]